MDTAQQKNQDDPFNVLKRFVRSRSAAVERCDLCAKDIWPEHPHLLEPANRQIHCSCDECAILFSNQGDFRYKRIPRDVRHLSDFRMTDLQWESLMLPIQLAFFFHSTPDERLIALYPSPAGAMESTLSLESWDDIVAENPLLGDLEADVEALLVNRVGQKREYFIAPIDKCYELVGLIRSKWHGLSGGTETWSAIDGFFGELKGRSQTVREAANA
ncbi:MAG: DUF5947 family protein [Pyrinomonadaceae bacterium]